MAKYLVVLTFDADTKKHEPDYECAEKKLAAIGLSRRPEWNSGYVELPFNTYAGLLDGEDRNTVADSITTSASAELAKCDIVGRLFVVATADYAWRTCSIGR